MTRLNLAILISGRGSNMQAILDACETSDYPAKPVLVLSNVPAAEGLKHASARGIATKAIDHKPFGKDRQSFEEKIHEGLLSANTEIIALAGFMRVLTPWFVNQWEGRMVNIHPSLLPKYPGLHTHKRALEAGDQEHGCTVHWVNSEVDQGAVIEQSAIRIGPEDTPDGLAERLLPVEHELYPSALAKACHTILER
ncbi:MAG: phosphoribosylglycinamide formyltransferase [Pseudomonadota bacterium]